MFLFGLKNSCCEISPMIIFHHGVDTAIGDAGDTLGDDGGRTAGDNLWLDDMHIGHTPRIKMIAAIAWVTASGNFRTPRLHTMAT